MKRIGAKVKLKVQILPNQFNATLNQEKVLFLFTQGLIKSNL